MDDRGRASSHRSAPLCVAQGGAPDLEDEEAANAARERYRHEPIATVPAPEEICGMLVAGERLVGMRPGALLERRQPAPGRRATSGLEGTLYLTTRRIILAGRSSLSFGLDTIRDVMLTGDQLLVLLCDGQGLTLRVPQPRLLRVELAAARLADQVAREGQPAAR